MTIEERADRYATSNGAKDLDLDEYDAYVQGAIDQQKIECDYWSKELVNAHKRMMWSQDKLIEKACKWIKDNYLVVQAEQERGGIMFWKEHFKQAIEE